MTLAMEHGVQAPRVAYVPFPYNLPMGEPGDRETHKLTALAALDLLYDLDAPSEATL